MPADTAAAPAGSVLLTQKQFADHKGWSKQYVNQLVRSGRIPLVNGKIDPVAADTALSRSRDPARDTRVRMRAPTSGSEAADNQVEERVSGAFLRARAVRENYQALMARAEYEVMAGKLVSAAEVRGAAFEIAREFRIQLFTTAANIGSAISAEFKIDRARAIEIAEGEIRAALEELAKRLETAMWNRKTKSAPQTDDDHRDIIPNSEIPE